MRNFAEKFFDPRLQGIYAAAMPLPMPADELRRRLRIAMNHGRYANVQQLADAIPDRGFSKDSLDSIFGGEADRISPSKLMRIADVCQVPEDYLLKVEFQLFPEMPFSEDRAREIAEYAAAHRPSETDSDTSVQSDRSGRPKDSGRSESIESAGQVRTGQKRSRL